MDYKHADYKYIEPFPAWKFALIFCAEFKKKDQHIGNGDNYMDK